jgi:hypothetical protein
MYIEQSSFLIPSYAYAQFKPRRQLLNIDVSLLPALSAEMMMIGGYELVEVEATIRYVSQQLNAFLDNKRFIWHLKKLPTRAFNILNPSGSI